MGDRKTAVEFFNAGAAAANDKSNPTNLQSAYQLFCAAAYADPTLWQSFYQLGAANYDLQKLEASIAAYRRTLECEMTTEERAKTLASLGWCLHKAGQTDEALSFSNESISLNPIVHVPYLNLSVIYGVRNETLRAVTYAQKAFDICQDAMTEMALTFAYLFDGQLAKGLKHFERRFEYKLHNFLHYPYPKWTGEPDKTVFLVADQGLGDTLAFARFLPQAAKRAKFVHAMIQPELMRAFTHAFAGIRNLVLQPAPMNFPQADCWTTFVSLPFALGLTDVEIRNARSVELPVFSMLPTWKVPDRKLHIGIAWAGSPLNEIDIHRNIPVTRFLDLYRTSGIQLYGLQVGDRAKELDDTGCAGLIRRLDPYIRDVVDTVTILQDLDLVICCESALGHIAGSADKECWIPYSYFGHAFVYGHKGNNIPWYKKHRFFLQDKTASWEPVFEDINKALRKRLREVP
jgi:tetratricopeptide (TPR) repeat protein